MTKRELSELEAAREALVYAVGMANGLLMIPRDDPAVQDELDRALETLRSG